MKKYLLLSVTIFALTAMSFKSADEDYTTCYFYYNGTDADGCTTYINGTYDCDSGDPESTFSGTVILGGGVGCINITITSAFANKDPETGAWQVPANKDVAFYFNNGSPCTSSKMYWIGNNASVVYRLNYLSPSILAKFQNDLCY